MSTIYSSKNRIRKNKRKGIHRSWFYNKHIRIDRNYIKSLNIEMYNLCMTRYNKNNKYYLIKVKDENFLEKFSVLDFYKSINWPNGTHPYFKDTLLLQFKYNGLKFNFKLNELFIINSYLYCVDYFINKGCYSFYIYKIKLNDNFKARILIEKYI